PAPWIDLLHAAFGDALPAGASTDAIVKAFAAAARDEMASALAAWDADPTELQVAAAEAGHYYEAVRPHLSADDEAVATHEVSAFLTAVRTGDKAEAMEAAEEAGVVLARLGEPAPAPAGSFAQAVQAFQESYHHAVELY